MVATLRDGEGGQSKFGVRNVSRTTIHALPNIDNHYGLMYLLINNSNNNNNKIFSTELTVQ